MTVILKNLTTEAQVIEEIGVVVPESGEINLSEISSSLPWFNASDLLTDLINQDKIIVNNGTSDLDKPTSIQEINFLFTQQPFDTMCWRRADGTIVDMTVNNSNVLIITPRS